MKFISAAVIFSICAFMCLSIEAQVAQCYKCVDNCEDPLPIVNCSSSSILEWRCYHARYNKGGEDLQYKGCVLKSDTDILCEEYIALGAKCYNCDYDLCNSAAIHTLSFVVMSSIFFLIVKFV